MWVLKCVRCRGLCEFKRSDMLGCFLTCSVRDHHHHVKYSWIHCTHVVFTLLEWSLCQMKLWWKKNLHFIRAERRSGDVLSHRQWIRSPGGGDFNPNFWCIYALQKKQKNMCMRATLLAIQLGWSTLYTKKTWTLEHVRTDEQQYRCMFSKLEHWCRNRLTV